MWFCPFSKCSHDVNGVAPLSAFRLHFITFLWNLLPLQICFPFTIRDISMPSGIQTSGTPKTALTMRLFPPRVPCPICYTLSSFFSKKNWQFTLPVSFPAHRPFIPKALLSHALNEKGIIHKKDLLSHTWSSPIAQKTTIKLEMCWFPWFHCSQLTHIPRLRILHH